MAKLKTGTRIYGDGVVDSKLQVTSGPILAGTATSTGTASQPLQVTGGAYVSGSVGIGITLPTRALDVNGEIRLRNALYDANNTVGTSTSVLISTGIGVSWIPIATAALQGIQGSSVQGITGTQGIQGLTGTGLLILGSVADVLVTPPNNAQTTLNAAFPGAGTGNGVINAANGNLWIYGGANWTDVGTVRGPQGVQGVQGVSGILGNRGGVPYTFSTTITDADPGTGVIRYNNATIGSVTKIFIDNTDSLSNLQTGWYDTWNDSSNTTSEGYLYITSGSSLGTVVNIFTVTAITVAAGYYKIDVNFISGSLPTDTTALAINFTRTGDSGTQGATGTATQGIQGISGGNGAPGTATQGVTGTQGAQGATGAGTQGAQGSPGTSPALPGTANQVLYKDSGNNATGSSNLTFDGTNLTCVGNISTGSDENIKTNITTIQNALDKVSKLRGVEFDYKINGEHSLGFIAQEVEKVIPDLVFGTDPKSVAYQNFVALLVEAIKELNQKVDRLTNNQL